MEDERRRILEMVEQGKLSAQEANELLGVLGEPEEEPPVQPEDHHRQARRGGSGCGWVGETVGAVVELVMRSLFRGPERRARRGE